MIVAKLVQMLFESIDDKIRDIILKSPFLGNISALLIVPGRNNDQAFLFEGFFVVSRSESFFPLRGFDR